MIIIGSSVKLLEVFLTGISQKESSFVNACLKALGKGGSIQEEVSLLAFCSAESVFKSLFPLFPMILPVRVLQVQGSVRGMESI